jgi:hypothetical protein
MTSCYLRLRILAALVFVLVLTIFHVKVDAQTLSELRVRVVDSTGRSLTGVSVTILGTDAGATSIEKTDDTGIVDFKGLRTGIYRLIVVHPFFTSVRQQIELDEGSVETVSVTLLREIGSVEAKSRVDVTAQSLSVNSLYRAIAPTVMDAISQLPGVDASSGAAGLGLSTSLRDEDSALTSYTIDGAPVNNASALAVDTDLLSNVTVDSSADLVRLAFLGPTIAPEYTADSSVGGYGTAITKASAQGTSGVIGYAFAHVVDGTNSGLNGQIYKDLSGLTYDHVGNAVSYGDYEKLAISSSNFTASILGLESNGYVNPIPAYLTGSTPAGYGPGNFQTSQQHNYVASLNASLGDTALSVSESNWAFSNATNFEKQYVMGVPAPYYANSAFEGAESALSLERAISPRVTAQLELSNSNTNQVGTASESGSSAIYQGETDAALSITAPLFRSGEARVILKRDFARSLGSSSSFNVMASAPLSTNTTLEATGQVGGRPVFSQDVQNVLGPQNPNLATYDCSSGTISASVAGATESAASSAEATVGINSNLRRGSIGASAFVDSLRGVLLSSAYVPASSESTAALPPGYLASLQKGFSSIGGCQGTPSLSQIYLVKDVGGISAIYRGVELNGEYTLGSRLTVQAGYDLLQARFLGGPPLVVGPSSPYIPGAQLPGRPFGRAAVTMDWLASPHNNMDVLLNLESCARNNPRNLPGYGVLNAGLGFSTSKYTNLVIAGSNLLNTYSGYFVSPRYAVPLSTPLSKLGTLAAPLPPASLFVRLYVHFGRS